MTAVEWLVDKLKGRSVDLEMPWNIDLVEQAKEMEKQQIINCCIQTTQDCFVSIMEHLNIPLNFTDEDLINQKLEAEQYYNETFKPE
jgi:hypothetical protein